MAPVPSLAFIEGQADIGHPHDFPVPLPNQKEGLGRKGLLRGDLTAGNLQPVEPAGVILQILLQSTRPVDIGATGQKLLNILPCLLPVDRAGSYIPQSVQGRPPSYSALYS